MLLPSLTESFIPMEFHIEFFPKPFPRKISHQHNLMLVGSCFTEQIGAKLIWNKFRVMQNPNGILFNPISILKSISRYATGTEYTKDDLFEHNGIWGSWDHHTRFSSASPDICLSKINSSLKSANAFLKSANWIFLTLGSAFIYERKEISGNENYTQVVANCHKIPPDRFHRRLLQNAETISILQKIIDVILRVNPTANIVFTISPVRHLRDGFIENNRSKAALIQAVHSVTNEHNVFYFPAYELVIDDLRDYRFYTEDMVHPNYAATNYVWEKFIATIIDDASKALMKDVSSVMNARNHKAFNPNSEQHKKFLQANIDKIMVLNRSNPEIDFEEELNYFELELKRN